jgi:hypothetical protein
MQPSPTGPSSKEIMGFSADFFGVRLSTFLRVGVALGVCLVAFIVGTLVASIARVCWWRHRPP